MVASIFLSFEILFRCRFYAIIRSCL